MKTIKCSSVGGGDCTFEVKATTKEEAKTMMGEHAKVAHAEMMASSTPESMQKWNEDFDNLWETTADDAESMPVEPMA